MSDTKATKADVWNTIYRELIGNGIVPVDIRLHPADILVTVELGADEMEDVAAALKAFGLPDGKPWTKSYEDQVHLWSKGEPDEFYAWGRYTWTDAGESPLLPGWGVEIYCQVRTANFPLFDEVAADAAVIVAESVAEPLTGEVVDPAVFGPCSGLAADKRDNTCTNFAAEYVEFYSSTVGLVDDEGAFSPATDGRRLCTSCADSVVAISSTPLTHGPGGVPVVRAEAVQP